MSNGNRAEAFIINLDDGDKKIKCLFNPKAYSFTKQNNYEKKKTSGGNVPQVTFGGGEPAKLEMELYFDTLADTPPGSKPKDVRKEYTDAIWKLMMVDEKLKDKKSKKGRPPRVRFQWGTAWSFNAVILTLTQKFTLFSRDGTPVRATLNVAFQQEKDQAQLGAQNPTSGGIGGERFWTVSEGDTLGWIAYKEYGQTSQWRAIAQANKLDNVRKLRPGTVLVIPNG